MKRILFPHESWERGPLHGDHMVVLSGLDDIVSANEIEARFKAAWPRCRIVIQRQWQHGGFLLVGTSITTLSTVHNVIRYPPHCKA